MDQLGLRIVFYLYPCLLILTLLGAQSFEFYRDRRRASRQPVRSAEEKAEAQKVQRTSTRAIWILQLLLSLLILASIVLTVRQAVIDQSDTDGQIDFPFSAYLVRVTTYQCVCTLLIPFSGVVCSCAAILLGWAPARSRRAMDPRLGSLLGLADRDACGRHDSRHIRFCARILAAARKFHPRSQYLGGLPDCCPAAHGVCLDHPGVQATTCLAAVFVRGAGVPAAEW
jgi:hypothetical protein